METNLDFMTQEQKVLLEKALCLDDTTAKYLKLICQDDVVCIEEKENVLPSFLELFMLLSASDEMISRYLTKKTINSDILETICQYGSPEVIKLLIAGNEIYTDELEIIFQRGDQSVILMAIKNYEAIDKTTIDGQIFVDFLKSRNIPEELEAYYQRYPYEDMVSLLQPENREVLVAELRKGISLSAEQFMPLVADPELASLALENCIIGVLGANDLLVLKKHNLPNQLLIKAGKRLNPKDVESFYQLFKQDRELFLQLMGHCRFCDIWDDCFEFDDPEFLEAIVENYSSLSFSMIWRAILRKHAHLLPILMKRKDFSRKLLTDNLHEMDSEVLVEFIRLLDRKLDGYHEANLLKCFNFQASFDYISRFGLNKNNENIIGDYLLAQERNDLIDLYGTNYGFRSKEGKQLWKEYQKAQKQIRRRQRWDKLWEKILG